MWTKSSATFGFSEAQLSQTRSEIRTAIDEYESMDQNLRTELHEILRLSVATDDNKFLFGTISKIAAGKERPNNDIFTFTTACYKFSGDYTESPSTFRNDSLHFVERYTVDASETGKMDLLALGDTELLGRVLIIGASPVCAT